jgi:hypothetical protein
MPAPQPNGVEAQDEFGHRPGDCIWWSQH